MQRVARRLEARLARCLPRFCAVGRLDFGDRLRGCRIAFVIPQAIALGLLLGLELRRPVQKGLEFRRDRAGAQVRDDLAAHGRQLLAGGDVLGRLDPQCDAAGLGALIPALEPVAVQEGEGADRQQDVHHRREARAPGPQDAADLLLVRVARRDAVALRAGPAHAVEDAAQDADDDVEDVEVAQPRDVERVDQALARRPVQQRGRHVPEPRHPHQQVRDDDQVHRVAQQALDAVGHHDRDLAALGRDQHRESEEDGHQQREGREHPTAEVQMHRQAAEVDDEARAHRREEGVVDDARDRLQHPREKPEAAAVAHLQKLPHRHGARLPEAVDAVAGQAEDDADGRREGSPEPVGEAGVVVRLEHRHQADQPHPRLGARDAQHVAPGHAPGRQEVGDAAHVALRPHADDDHDQNRRGDDGPVQPMHVGFLPVYFNT